MTRVHAFAVLSPDGRHRMKLIAWIFRIVLFALLFVLALRNTEDASLQLFLGAVGHAPLILILLAAFGLGIVAALAAVALALMRQRMEATGRAARWPRHACRCRRTPCRPRPSPAFPIT